LHEKAVSRVPVFIESEGVGVGDLFFLLELNPNDNQGCARLMAGLYSSELGQHRAIRSVAEDIQMVMLPPFTILADAAVSIYSVGRLAKRSRTAFGRG